MFVRRARLSGQPHKSIRWSCRRANRGGQPERTTLWHHASAHSSPRCSEDEAGHGSTAGGIIQLAVVLRFVDIATDALADAREEIDALNVYPVPDGDTGTNMYLTISAARDAIREAVGDDAEGRRPRHALAAFARGALLGARGNSGVILSQMLGAIAAPDRRAAAGRPERDGHRRGAAAGDRRELRRGREAGRGHHAHRRPRRLRRRAWRRRRTRPAGRATCSPPPPTAAREALARTPEQLKVLRDAGVVDAGGRGLCVILDAAETVLTGRRPAPVQTRLGEHRHPGAGPGRRPHRGRPGVRGDVPPRRRRRRDPAAPADARAARRLARRRRRRGPLERPRPRRRRRRRDRGRHRRRSPPPGPGHPLRRAGRRRPPEAPRTGAAAGSSPSPPAPAWPRCSRRPARSSSRAARAAARPPASSSRRSPTAAPRRSSCCPTTPTRCASPRSPPGPPRPTTAIQVVGDPDPARRCRAWRRSPCTSPAAASTRTSSR